MKKLIVAAALSCVVLAACGNAGSTSEYKVEVNTDTLVVFVAEDIEGDMSWKDYFDGLEKEGLITYSMDGTMLSELNGKSNADGNYWLFYSDLVELDGEIYGNASWGTYEYEGEQLAACSYGIELMPIIEGYTYAAVYTTYSS